MQPKNSPATCSNNPKQTAPTAINQQPQTDSRQPLTNRSRSIFQNTLQPTNCNQRVRAHTPDPTSQNQQNGPNDLERTHIAHTAEPSESKVFQQADPKIETGSENQQPGTNELGPTDWAQSNNTEQPTTMNQTEITRANNTHRRDITKNIELTSHSFQGAWQWAGHCAMRTGSATLSGSPTKSESTLEESPCETEILYCEGHADDTCMTAPPHGGSCNVSKGGSLLRIPNIH